MSPIIEESADSRADSKEDDGLNLDAARFITWSIIESTQNRLVDQYEINPWLDSGTNEEFVSRCPCTSVSTHIG